MIVVEAMEAEEDHLVTLDTMVEIEVQQEEKAMVSEAEVAVQEDHQVSHQMVVAIHIEGNIHLRE